MRNMAGFACQLTIVTPMRVFRQEICGVRNMLIADVTLQAYLVVVGNWKQFAFSINGVIPKQELNAASDLRLHRIVMTFLALHPGLVMHVVQVVACEIRSYIEIHDVACRAEFRAGV